MAAPIIEIVAISIEPNNPKIVGEESVPVKPTVEGFTFERLPNRF